MNIVAENPPVAKKAPVAAKKTARTQKWLKRIKYIFLGFALLLLVQAGTGYWLLSSRWQMYVSDDQMVRFANEVKVAQPVPGNFKSFYKRIFPNHIGASMSEQIFFNYGARIILKDKNIDAKPHCYCDQVYDMQSLKNTELASIEWNGRLQDMEYGFGMEKYSSPEKCFDYVFQEKLKDLKATLDPAQFSFLTKNVEDLNEDEMIEVILLMQSKFKFNKYKDPVAFQKAFDRYKARLLEPQKA